MAIFRKIRFYKKVLKSAQNGLKRAKKPVWAYILKLVEDQLFR